MVSFALSNEISLNFLRTFHFRHSEMLIFINKKLLMRRKYSVWLTPLHGFSKYNISKIFLPQKHVFIAASACIKNGYKAFELPRFLIYIKTLLIYHNDPTHLAGPQKNYHTFTVKIDLKCIIFTEEETFTLN